MVRGVLFWTLVTCYITSFAGTGSHEEKTYKYDTIFPLTKLEFEKKQYCVPGNWDAYLTHFYGNYMELPPVEQRKTHSPLYIIFDEKV